VIGAVVTYRIDRHQSRLSVFILVFCFVLNLWTTFRPSWPSKMRFNYRAAILAFCLVIVGVYIYAPYVWTADPGVSDCKRNPLVTFPARSYEFLWASSSKRVEGLNICDKLQPPFKDFVRAPMAGEIHRSLDIEHLGYIPWVATLIALVIGMLVGRKPKSDGP
jgi:hypothetical protein